MEATRPIGRPSLYKPEYCENVIEFFNRPLTTQKKITRIVKGAVVELTADIACQLPTLERYALNLGVHIDTIYEWAKVHKDFSEALKIAKQAQHDILVQHGLNGSYDAKFAQFIAMNVTNMKNKVEVDIEKPIELAYDNK